MILKTDIDMYSKSSPFIAGTLVGGMFGIGVMAGGSCMAGESMSVGLVVGGAVIGGSIGGISAQMGATVHSLLK